MKLTKVFLCKFSVLSDIKIDGKKIYPQKSITLGTKNTKQLELNFSQKRFIN